MSVEEWNLIKDGINLHYNRGNQPKKENPTRLVCHGMQLDGELTDNRQHQNNPKNSGSNSVLIRPWVFISDHVGPSCVYFWWWGKRT
jgi:hypothetical protein